jgi:hypothetical protein
MATEIVTPTGVAAAVGAKLLYDVCGPTAKYLGGELASYSEVGVNNLKRVFEHAAKRLRELGKVDGQVPPRVLKEILAEGYYCEDETQACYLGGVLASSKGPTSRDDRATAYCSLISSLSTYQLRTHFILYASILRAKKTDLEKTLSWLQKHDVTVAIKEADYHAAMDFSTNEQPLVIAQHAFVGLEKRGLSEGGMQVVQPYRHNATNYSDVPFHYFYPTALGIELFLWGHGVGDRGIEGFTQELAQKLVTSFNVEPYQIVFGKVMYP